MVPHEVIRIIGEPQEMKLPMDHLTVDYWSVPVIMRKNYDQYESTVTFETYEEAVKLRVGMVFDR